MAAQDQGAQARRRDHRDRWPRRPPRSRRLAAAQRPRSGSRSCCRRRSLVNLDDMLEKVRAIKSAEEIGVLGAGGELGDLMLCGMPRNRAARRQGMRGIRPHERGDAVERRRGADTVPLGLRSPFPTRTRSACPRRASSRRGNVIICEIHPKYGSYFTHVERTFSIGAPPARAARHLRGVRCRLRGTGLPSSGPGA